MAGRVASQERRHPDSVQTDSGKLVRISTLGPNQFVKIGGKRIYGRDIPLSIFTLTCGHTGKGVAVSVGDVFFCDDCQTNRSVSTSRS